MEDINTSTQTMPVQPAYAGFWRRLAAYVIDGTILNVAMLPFVFIFLRNSGLWDLIEISRKLPPGASELINMIDPGYDLLLQNVIKEIFYFVLFQGIFILFYYAIWESSKFMATPGKMATGIVVTDSNGQRISFMRALGRNFSKIFSRMILLIGYLMALWTEKQQALHDLISSCVVTRSSNVSEPAVTYTYAGFWRRFVAYLLDSFLIYIFLSPVNFLLLPAGTKNPVATLLNLMQHPDAPLPQINDIIRLMTISTIASLITFFYFASWESSRFQATPGKLAIGIKVTDLNGQKLSFWRASGRYVAKFVSSATLLIGYMMAGWTKHGQALHDELSNSLVVTIER